MKYSRLISLALAGLGLVSIAPSAFANKFVKSAPNNDVIGTGFTAGQDVPFTYSGVVSPKDVSANSCGVVNLSKLSGDAVVTVNGQSYNLSSVTAVSSPPSYSVGDCWFRDVRKMVEADGTYKLFIGGLSPSVRYPVSISGPAVRTVKANACGFVRLSNSGVWRDKSFSYNNNAITPASIATLPQCKNGTALYPVGFPGMTLN